MRRKKPTGVSEIVSLLRVRDGWNNKRRKDLKMKAYSCAKRAADPSNEHAACRQWCGNAETCLRTDDSEEALMEAMERFYGTATPEMQAYLRGDGPKPDEACSDITGRAN